MMKLTLSTTFFTLLVLQAVLTVKSHTSEDDPLSNDFKSLRNGAKLVLSLESGGAIVRRARGSDIPRPDVEARIVNTTLKTNVGGSAQKILKSPGNGNKKLGKNQDLINVSNGVRNKHHSDKKQPNSGEQEQQQQQQTAGKRQRQSANQQQHANGNAHRSGSSRSNKQRQGLKSQQHQDHRRHQSGKRNGGVISIAENKERGNASKAQSTCRYTKSAWSDCDPKTNTHSRTLTLKRGDMNCSATRTIQKKCKKACRYEKGTWSECKGGAMTRVDNLKISSALNASPDSNCEAARSVSRKCNPDGNVGKTSKSQNFNGNKVNKKDRKNKDKLKPRTNAQQD